MSNLVDELEMLSKGFLRDTWRWRIFSYDAVSRVLTYSNKGVVKGRATVVGVGDLPDGKKRPHRFNLQLERDAANPGVPSLTVRAADADTKARWLGIDAGAGGGGGAGGRRL